MMLQRAYSGHPVETMRHDEVKLVPRTVKMRRHLYVVRILYSFVKTRHYFVYVKQNILKSP